MQRMSVYESVSVLLEGASPCKALLYDFLRRVFIILYNLLFVIPSYGRMIAVEYVGMTERWTRILLDAYSHCAFSAIQRNFVHVL